MTFLFVQDQEFVYDCSIYTFRMKSKTTWEKSKKLCEQIGSKLVSMERLTAELSFLTNHSEIFKMNTTQYYIGLKKYGQKWVWISDNSTLEETETGEFPWAKGQPKGDGNCAKMWCKKNTSPCTYVYDDVECTPITTNIGYICERRLTSLECGRNGESLEIVNHMHIMLACYSTVHGPPNNKLIMH